MTGAPAQSQDRLTTSAVVCTYTEERWPLLVAAVESLRAQSQPPDELLLVVDHNPGLARRLRRRFPGARVVENEGGPGISATRNTALHHAHGEVIVFLDDDTVAGPGWLRRHLEHYRTDPGTLAAGGRAVPRWTGAEPAWFPEEFGWVVGCSYLGQPARPAAVRNLFTCNMSVRRRPGQRLPSFEGHRVGTMERCEDTQFCIELGRSVPEGRILFDPSLVVEAAVPPERATLRYFVARCWAEGRAKAGVTASVGPGAALADERRYVVRTLGPAVARHLRAAARGRPHELARAAAILLGLAVTVAGFAYGTVRHLGSDHRA